MRLQRLGARARVRRHPGESLIEAVMGVSHAIKAQLCLHERSAGTAHSARRPGMAHDVGQCRGKLKRTFGRHEETPLAIRDELGIPTDGCDHHG